MIIIMKMENACQWACAMCSGGHNDADDHHEVDHHSPSDDLDVALVAVQLAHLGVAAGAVAQGPTLEELDEEAHQQEQGAQDAQPVVRRGRPEGVGEVPEHDHHWQGELREGSEDGDVAEPLGGLRGSHGAQHASASATSGSGGISAATTTTTTVRQQGGTRGGEELVQDVEEGQGADRHRGEVEAEDVGRPCRQRAGSIMIAMVAAVVVAAAAAARL